MGIEIDIAVGIRHLNVTKSLLLLLHRLRITSQCVLIRRSACGPSVATAVWESYCRVAVWGGNPPIGIDVIINTCEVISTQAWPSSSIIGVAGVAVI